MTVSASASAAKASGDASDASSPNCAPISRSAESSIFPGSLRPAIWMAPAIRRMMPPDSSAAPFSDLPRARPSRRCREWARSSMLSRIRCRIMRSSSEAGNNVAATDSSDVSVGAIAAAEKPSARLDSTIRSSRATSSSTGSSTLLPTEDRRLAWRAIRCPRASSPIMARLSPTDSSSSVWCSSTSGSRLLSS